jgi:hypothetical protein
VITKLAHQLLLDELFAALRGCERMLYRAQPHPEGVELSGSEADFEELKGAVAFEANHATGRTRRRRWDDVYASLYHGGQSWIEPLVDVVVEELDGFDLVAG